ncbi:MULTISPECIES: carbohydrate ABC transporter permease [Halanaerobium]|jgi:arabinogalactan oligomer/maltooligosaccharide transport system permease protein|uniref:Arabinogalactan oligomer/maltooligosaccharide transport system permease protein n=1 Tax=Halanaerobium saccharolyticum TaxID=43595 RepID=A0A4R6SJ92_9FIRM|nr:MULTISPECIES: sugar ABC transporter permease [Halanaerobium]PUU89373.1 MAG: carbohydrate ABC transporter membrane protein 1 [Halanaerobium sp.]PUU93546.1 MAG: carbohydrate ABC transporter membrane protein 1 [Halanaerobium sp.]TDQ03937.1 arabinogalactan oligomer/maltooligosaccharide transport system permease protein [Halanaerobium saccharolyticum]
MSQPGENLRFTSALSNFSLKDFWREHKFSYLMLLPAFIVVLFVVIYPFFYNFRLAFSNLNMYNMRQFIQSDKLTYIGIDNFIKIITESSFWIILARTVAWTVINVVAHVTFGIFYAIILDRDLMFKSIYRTLLVIPWAIPQYIVVLIWKGMFNFRYGAVNLLLRKIGVPGVAWLSQASTGFSAALIVNIWLGIPFMMMIALGGLQSIDPNFYEAAEIDGASSWQQIKHITLPLLKPVMLPAVILGVVWTFNNLRVIYLLTQNTLTNKIDILVTHVYRSAFEFYRYGYAAAFSIIIFVILLVWAISFIDYINED